MNNQPFKFDKNTTALFQAILTLSSVKESEAFFRDLCTVEEIKDMSDRWQVVLLLQKGLSYRVIAEKLNTSTTTVARVAFWLENGRGGYKNMLKKLFHHHSNPRPGKV